jgi:peptidylprolyl isomerase
MLFMNIDLKKFIIIPLFLLLISCDSSGDNENTVIFMKTTLGDIKIMLYDGTPVHRDNFIKLIKSGFYESVTFHRVIKDFMVQAGDPATKTLTGVSLPDSLNTYTIPAEFMSQYFHKRGALAAAREGNDVNPEMRSSGTQFYIVQGIKYNDQELNLAEQRINNNIKQSLFNKILNETADSIRISEKPLTEGEVQEIASIKMFNYLSATPDYKIPEDQRIVYKNIGGVPRLDRTYTVFGEVIEGMDVVDKIAAVSTDSSDKPLNDIKIIKIKILK